MDKDFRISLEDAYVAMFRFLEIYYNNTKSDDVGALLGSMQLRRRNGLPLDVGNWDLWLEAVSDAVDKRVDIYTDLMDTE
jgi:hypothetical protein